MPITCRTTALTAITNLDDSVRGFSRRVEIKAVSSTMSEALGMPMDGSFALKRESNVRIIYVIERQLRISYLGEYESRVPNMHVVGCGSRRDHWIYRE